MEDSKLMQRALDLAKRGTGKTLKNPLVGAVIVKDGKIIGEGYHHEYGDVHAEVDALRNVTADPAGASLYVNLEPCSHQGKQPPCVDEVIKAGIKEVFIANIDTNPKVDGIKILEEAGIKVHTGLLEEEGKKLNEAFFFHIANKRPMVALKYAMTMDGKIATASGDSKWISGEESRHYVHELRSKYDAIIVGKGTAIADDPSLNARIEGGIDPIRVIITSSLDLPADLKVFNLTSDKKTYLATCSDETNPYKAEVIRCEEKAGRVDLEDLLAKLYEMNIGSVLVEGGSVINGAFLDQGLVDKVYSFIAPKILGGSKSISPVKGDEKDLMKEASDFKIVDVKRFGNDVMIEADNVYRYS